MLVFLKKELNSELMHSTYYYIVHAFLETRVCVPSQGG